MYDDAEDQFFQGYPSQVRQPRPVLASVVASVITTVIVFFGLRMLDNAGAFGKRAPAPAAQHAVGTSGAAQVPSLVGMKLDQARELLKGRGLLISIAEERDAVGQPGGSILAQNPLPGSETPVGTTVQLIISRAVASVIVPPVAGQKVEDAIAALAAQGFKLGPHKTGVNAPGVAPGLVAGSEPAAGSPVAPGAVVSLLVAGVAGKPVPNVIGSRLTRAKKLLEDAGFKLGRTRYRYDPCCGEYIILEQTPGASAAAAPGTAVDLVVNEPG